MYVNSVAPEVGDVVASPAALGDVLEITPNGTGGHMYVTVRWRKAAVKFAIITP